MSIKKTAWQVLLVLSLYIAQLHQCAGLKVMVLGANGRTGRKVVDVSLKKGFETVAVTRSGELIDQPTYSLAKNLQLCKGDVVRPESIKLSNDIDAVIFCCSASKEGGSAQEVDRDGVISMAKACIASGIPRYVIVSSGAVSKPWSPVYLFLNLFGGIMKAKFDGEEAVRKIYKSADAKLGYTIVRPGGLTEEDPLGVSGLELNQRDEKSGRVSRWDVAAVCVESILSCPSTSRVTLEVYNKDTGRPLSQVGFSNLIGLRDDKSKALGSMERRGSTWTDIFAGLQQDSN